MTVVVCVATAVAAAAVVSASASHAPRTSRGARFDRSRPRQDEIGIGPGKIKHVWLVILENKSYDASFTGLNKNTYLWRQLPKQGALLKNYYGTGHFSLDNYISMVSGQATQPDTQADCPFYDRFSGHLVKSGSLFNNSNYGQLASAAGPNAAPGSNGCVYPSNVQTLFNQLDAAHRSWKGYAQDLGNEETRSSLPHSAGIRYCGAPFAAPGPTGSTAEPNPGSADAGDQYLPKHFPFPWFESILNSGDCNRRHIADLFDPTNGLYHDLQSSARTPAFSWISPNDCSDGHDAVCHGNNLSGGFSGPNTARKPVNYTGGLYAADLFLEHVIPEIERSPAFREGGLIDITFDEGFPPFTYTGNSFANSTKVLPNAQTSIENDSAAETIYGHDVHYEPTGPNTPLARSKSGQELYPGPGDNAFIDRPSNCVAQKVPALPSGTCLLGGGSSIAGPRADAGATAAAGSTKIVDNSIVATDPGRSVTGDGIPAGAFVGPVTNSPLVATKSAQEGGIVDTGSFTLVDSSRHPIATTGAVSGVQLGGRSARTDPLYDYGDPTTGGGDTGSVLISPFIRPGTVSKRFYNHYSWLRTMEDLFQVSDGRGRSHLPGGTGSPGLDGKGHLGYAAQPGLAPFGSDVFDNPDGPNHRRVVNHDGLPKWLPAAKMPVNNVVTATAAKPALAIQGDTVAVRLRGGRVMATAVGPRVPEDGEFPVPSTSPCTFVLTLTSVAGTVPISPGAFTVVDDLGHLHHPEVSALSGGPPPKLVPAGKSVSLRIHGVLPTGNGALGWAPAAERVVSWDFNVEID